MTKLIFFCGKMASGKTTLAKELAGREGAVVLNQDLLLDFPGNTKSQRAWFRELFEQAGVAHELHFIDAPDALCKRQLRERSKDLPPGTPWTSEAEFDLIMAHFLPPSEDEGFNVTRHQRALAQIDGDSRDGS